MAGKLTISVEVELGWGYHDLERENRYSKFSSKRQLETKRLKQFLDVLDRHELPVTFDIVGHLFLQSCDGDHSGEYPSGWFDEDPATDSESDPLFYAPDMIEAIRSADINHEIATHTFSHILADEIPVETFKSELETVQFIHQEHLQEDSVSLVPPRHREVPKSKLHGVGIKVLRVPAHTLPDSSFSRLLWYLFGNHPVKDPKIENGIVESYTSPGMSLTAPHLPTGQRSPHPVFWLIPTSLRKRLHSRYLENALERTIEQNSHVHLWTHLHDMANDIQWNIVNDFVNLIDEPVAEGDLCIKTMADLSEFSEDYQ